MATTDTRSKIRPHGEVALGNAIRRIVDDLYQQEGIRVTESEVRREVLESAHRNRILPGKIAGYLINHPEARHKFSNVLCSTREIVQARARQRLNAIESSLTQHQGALPGPSSKASRHGWLNGLLKFGAWLAAFFALLVVLFRAMRGAQRS